MANIKKLALGLLVVVLAFGFSAFKGDVWSSKPLATAWFEISVTAPASDPDNQTVTGLAATPPSGTDPSLCAQLNTGQYCSVEISYDETVDPDDFNGKTVTEILALPGVTAGGSNYAFQP